VKTARSRLLEFNSAALTVLTTVFLVSGGASAKNHKVKTSDKQVVVVAHISFPGLSAVDMAIQKKVNDKYYLYVQHSRDQGISIIDISKPAQPKTVGVIPWPDPAVSGRVNVMGDLAIIAGTADRPMRGSTSNDDLVLWDLSNPVAPRVVQKFSGVVKWLQDERNFIYILNGDGLWVVSNPAEHQPEQMESSNSGE